MSIVAVSPPAAGGLAVRDASPRQQPLSGGLRMAYSVGAAPDAVVNAAINVFLLYYVTTICGLSPGLAGLALAAGLVVDAVLDPWIGMRSDHCRSRWGRRLPFMLGATPVLLASFCMLFSLPRIDDQGLLFTIVLLLCLTIRVSLSFFNLPFLAVGAEVSDDDLERSRIITWRWAAGMISTTATVLVGFGLFFKGAQGISIPENYPPFALALSALVLLTAAMASLAVHRTLGRQHPAPANEAATPRELLRELRQLFRSATFRTIFFTCLLCCGAQAVTQSLSLHAYTFFWKFSSDQTQTAIVAFTFGLILGAPIGGLLVRRWEHRTTIFVGVCGLILAQATPASLRLCGLLPFEGAALAAIVATAMLVAGAMMTIAALALLSMTTEAVDEHELQYGVRIEGLYFASWTLAVKAANGLGTLLSGVALQLIAFPTKTAGDVDAAARIPERTAQLLGLVYGPGAAALAATTLLVVLGYRLDRRKHRQIMAELQSRKSGAVR